MFHGKISLSIVLLLLLVNLVSGFRLELIYISLIVIIRSSLIHSWFSAACAAAIVHRNHFFRLYQQNKSSKPKVKFRQASNCCKRFLEAAKLAYANKRKAPITSQKLGSRSFWPVASSVLNKIKSAIPALFNSPDVFFYNILIKQNCLLKTSLRTLIFMTQVSLYLFSLLELI